VNGLPEGLTSLGRLPSITAGIADLPDHPWAADDLPPDGVAVSQLNPPVPAGHENVEIVRGWWNLDDAQVARLTTPFMCATDGRFKLLRRDDRDRHEELIDLEADPLELEPTPVGSSELPAAATAAVTRLRAALDHPSAARAAPREPLVDAPPEPTEEETKAIEERMRLLGYL
jgi:hypothetical protein